MAEAETDTGRRRLDRIQAADYATGPGEFDLDEVRNRRDECLAEREYLSYLRRMIQGRIEILKAEQHARASGEEAPLVDRLAAIFADRKSVV